LIPLCLILILLHPALISLRAAFDFVGWILKSSPSAGAQLTRRY
jgi:hypothetical protein